jgi:hypothetical protein
LSMTMVVSTNTSTTTEAAANWTNPNQSDKWKGHVRCATAFVKAIEGHAVPNVNGTGGRDLFRANVKKTKIASWSSTENSDGRSAMFYVNRKSTE